jgi:hypothetical protein
MRRPAFNDPLGDGTRKRKILPVTLEIASSPPVDSALRVTIVQMAHLPRGNTPCGPRTASALQHPPSMQRPAGRLIAS